jgi:RHS repeat-associated protein
VGGPWVFPFGEERGNRFFTDTDGAFVQDVGYEPYGGAHATGRAPGAADYTHAQWNGGDVLAAFGLVHLGARLYDPVIGRFLSRDPLLVSRSASMTNPYAFAANDPVNHADPTGLDPIGPGQVSFGICGTSHGGPCTNPAADSASPIGGFLGILGWLGAQIVGAASSGANPQAALPSAPQTPEGKALMRIMVENEGLSRHAASLDWDNLARMKLDEYDDMVNHIRQAQATFLRSAEARFCAIESSAVLTALKRAATPTLWERLCLSQCRGGA